MLRLPVWRSDLGWGGTGTGDGRTDMASFIKALTASFIKVLTSVEFSNVGVLFQLLLVFNVS